VPAGFGRAKIRCDECGYYAPVPEKLRSAAAEDDETPPLLRRPRKTRRL